MAPVYTRRLFAGKLPELGESVVYTSPGVERVVIRDIAVTNASDTEGTQFGIYLGPSDVSTLFYLLYIPRLPPGTTHLDLRQAMAVSEPLYVYNTHANTHLALTGYVFADG